MKIAILQDDFPPRNFGGAGAVAFTSAKELQKRGHDVLVITTAREAVSEKSEYEGIQVRTITNKYDYRFQAYVSLWNPAVVRRVKVILDEFKPEVVHAHNVHGHLSYASLKAAKQSGAKVILTSHDAMPFNYGKFVQYIDPHTLSVLDTFDYRVSPWRQFKEERLRYNPLRNMIVRYIVRKYVDTLVAVSDALKHALEQNGFGYVHVVHNGIEVSEWSALPEDIDAFKQKHGVGEHAIFFTGKPPVVKGGTLLLRALVSVLKDVPDAQILVAGREDDQTMRLHALARELHLEDRLIFSGWITGKDLAVAYHSCAIAVVPSICFDSFPTVNLEAMASHLPVIATCFGGSREAVLDDATGYIVNPFDVEHMASKISEILDNTDKRQRFGAAGYARVEKEFTIERQIEAYETLYRN